MSECCELMERCLHSWSDRAAGLVTVTLAKRNDLVGKKVELTKRYAYREKASTKSQIIYINFCPWCGQRYNEGLQD